ncbi:MYB DNA-binding domain protein [Aspergillus nomiae NRRL 13137]|uniref:MYB DNA-binding domain protein n=1 Tax=Aspergillus nomiae NRRL (strain ATCC 15546 / NRRL 13137 / CBS 260.88 / M93) TaxID=1509407 RepID=A0A0L1ILV6_ASPN3|nr:MYB DNA-binding domain protein [Aspergillus nomiae NRRL 13137]KNG80544.1 MYB DNA-binding domain protein [Aspergillus nomiae NRRL 13137]
MGNRSSKKAENGIRDLTQKVGSDVTPSRPKSLKAKEKETPKGQSDDAATPKRKRKSSKHDNSAVAPPSPPAEEEPRPSKRKKLTDSPTDSTEDGRQAEKASAAVIDNSPAEAQVNGTPSTKSSNDAAIPQVTVKKGKRQQSGKGLTGFFTQDEVQALESFKLEFCNSHGLPAHAFDAMVQHSEREKGIDFPCDSSITMKPEFWKTIYKILPDRDRRSVYRFMRRHFQNSDVKPHQWTHEQDEELVQLVARYGFKFAQIAKELGRSDDDVVQRWKNRLEHRTTMNRGPWSEEEIRSLQNALQVVWKNMKEKGHEVGRDIYDMDETLISWGHISNKIGNCRSRQQCADKWRKAKRKVQQLRDRGNPDAVFDPVKESKNSRQRSRPPSPTPQPPPKSAEYIYSDNSDEDEAVEQHEKKAKSGKTSTKDSSSSDKSSSSDSESESTNESNSSDTTKDVQSKAKRNERVKVKDQLQATESKKNTKTTPQKRKQSTSTSSTSDSEESDSSTGSDVPAHPQTSTNSKPKISPEAPKSKDKNEESSSKDDSSDSSDDGSSESDAESESESDVTSSSGNEKGKPPKKALDNIKQQAKDSSSEESTSESGESESDSSESESESTPASKSSKSEQQSTKEAGALKRRRLAELSSTSTSTRSSVSRDVKMEGADN